MDCRRNFCESDKPMEQFAELFKESKTLNIFKNNYDDHVKNVEHI